MILFILLGSKSSNFGQEIEWEDDCEISSKFCLKNSYREFQAESNILNTSNLIGDKDSGIRWLLSVIESDKLKDIK